jgi:hypothetical protein
MNPQALAALHRRRALSLREQAEIDDAIAVEYTAQEAPAPKPSRRRPPPAPLPVTPPSELDQARARRDLRRIGAVPGRTR